MVKSYFKKNISSSTREMTKIPIKKFLRIHANELNEIWQLDLFFYDMMGQKKLLSVIDIYSRKGWVVKLANKKAETVRDAYLYAVNKMGGEPKIMMLDGGTEFKREFMKHVEDKGIEIRIAKGNSLKLTSTKLKQAIVERYNSTMRSLMKSYLLEENKRILKQEHLDILSEGYNNHTHSSIGYSPNEIVDEGEIPIIKIRKYHIYKTGFEVGDFVRVLKQYKDNYSKGRKDKINYSKTVYEIIEKDHNKYKLNDGEYYPYTRLIKSKDKLTKTKKQILKRVQPKRKVNKIPVSSNKRTSSRFERK